MDVYEAILAGFTMTMYCTLCMSLRHWSSNHVPSLREHLALFAIMAIPCISIEMIWGAATDSPPLICYINNVQFSRCNYVSYKQSNFL